MEWVGTELVFENLVLVRVVILIGWKGLGEEIQRNAWIVDRKDRNNLLRYFQFWKYLVGSIIINLLDKQKERFRWVGNWSGVIVGSGCVRVRIFMRCFLYKFCFLRLVAVFSFLDRIGRYLLDYMEMSFVIYFRGMSIQRLVNIKFQGVFIFFVISLRLFLGDMISLFYVFDLLGYK